MESNRKLLWVSRILMLASAVAIPIAHYHFYNPISFMLGMNVSAQMGQTIVFGGFALGIAVFSWVWPGAGGIVAMLYGLLQLLWYVLERLSSTSHPLFLIPGLAYYALYGIFLIGGLLNLIAGLMQKTAPYSETVTDKRLRRAARITAFATVALGVITSFIPHYGTWWAIYCSFPAVVCAGIAWRWPAPGGILMLLFATYTSCALFASNWDFSEKLLPYVLLLIYIASGLLHLIIAGRIAWLRRRNLLSDEL